LLDVITICSKSFVHKVFKKIDCDIEFDNLSAELHWDIVENDQIKIDIYYFEGDFIVSIGTKTKDEWEDFFEVKEDRLNCIFYKLDFDMVMLRLKENSND